MDEKIERMLVAKATRKGVPINATLELTPLCNMNCNMCFVRQNKSDLDQELLSVAQWKDIIIQMKEAGTLFVSLTGGEPLLYDGFKEIYLMLHKMGMVVTVNTNGTLIDKSMVDFFIQYPPRRINITLYGSSNETYDKLCHNTGGFIRVMSAIKLLKQKGIQIKLNGTIVPENYNEMDELNNIAKSLNIPIEMETYIYPAHRERKCKFDYNSRLSASDAGCAYFKECQFRFDDGFSNYVDMVLNDLEEYKHRPEDLPASPMECHGGKASLFVNWKGRMQPCIFMDHVSIDILENGFDASWQYIKQKTSEIYLPKECSNCDLRVACSVCAAKCYLENHDFNQVPKYLCEYTQKVVELMKKRK